VHPTRIVSCCRNAPAYPAFNHRVHDITGRYSWCLAHVVTEHRHLTTSTLPTCGKESLKGQTRLDTLTGLTQLHTLKFRPLMLHCFAAELFAQVGLCRLLSYDLVMQAYNDSNTALVWFIMHIAQYSIYTLDCDLPEFHISVSYRVCIVIG